MLLVKKFYLGLTVILLILIWSVPILAVEETSTQSTQNTQTITQTTQTVQPVVAAQQVTVQQSGGLKPISPEKVQSKVDAIENWIVALFAPIIHLMSKLSLILAVLLILTAVFARQLFGRAFMVIGCVVIGMAIFSNVGAITDTIQWAGQWLGQ